MAGNCLIRPSYNAQVGDTLVSHHPSVRQAKTLVIRHLSVKQTETPLNHHSGGHSSFMSGTANDHLPFGSFKKISTETLSPIISHKRVDQAAVPGSDDLSAHLAVVPGSDDSNTHQIVVSGS